MMEEDQTEDPSTPLIDAAVSMHEIFVAYLEAGFTEQQALTLLSAMIKNMTPGNA